MDPVVDIISKPLSQISPEMLRIIVVLIGSRYALRSSFLDLIFGNVVGRAVALFFVMLWAYKDINTSLMYTVIVSIALIVLDSFFPEGFDIENRDINIGCMDMTYDDILDKFGGDKERMRRAMFNAVNTNYTSAPLAATQIMTRGYNLGDKCKTLSQQN